MRSRKALLWLVPSAAALAVAFPAFAGNAPPGAAFPWGQPGTAEKTADCTQPPPSIPIVCENPIPGSSYAWTQPGTAPVVAQSAQPPAWIPTVS